MRFVRNVRRGPARSRSDWRVVAEVDPALVEPMEKVPRMLLEHWETLRQPLGYASIAGLSKNQLRCLAALAKNGGVRLGVNRWGDVHAFQVVQ